MIPIYKTRKPNIVFHYGRDNPEIVGNNNSQVNKIIIIEFQNTNLAAIFSHVLVWVGPDSRRREIIMCTLLVITARFLQ